MPSRALPEGWLLVLLIAFRYSMTEPNAESGFERMQSIACHNVDPTAFHDALAACLRDGLIRDPVRLP